MKIEKLFSNLNYHKDLIFYLFEHRDKTITQSECEKYISFEKLEVLENFEIIEKFDENISLDNRVVEFLEKYLNIDEYVEVSSIYERLEDIKHHIEIALEYKNKQGSLLPQIRRELKKCDISIMQNLLKLRIHIDRVYKNIDEFSLKLKELRYYEKKLKELTAALNEFESFLKLYAQRLSVFYNSELNSLIQTIKSNHLEINRSLIPLTQDVCEYINKALAKNIFIEKLTRLKELKDNLSLKESTDIVKKLEKFDNLQTTISIKTILDDEIISDESFYRVLNKSNTLKKRTKKVNKISHYDTKEEFSFINIDNLHLGFKFSNQNLIEYLLTSSELNNKDFEEVLQIYCKMILMYEKEYIIEQNIITLNNTTLKKVRYGSR